MLLQKLMRNPLVRARPVHDEQRQATQMLPRPIFSCLITTTERQNTRWPLIPTGDMSLYMSTWDVCEGMWEGACVTAARAAVLQQSGEGQAGKGRAVPFTLLEAFPFPSKFNNCQITFSEVCGEVVCDSSTPKLSLRSWIQKQRAWFSSQPLLCCWEFTPPQSGLLHRTERKSESVFSVRQQYSCFISVANCLFSSSKPQHFNLKGIQDELMLAHNICHIPSLSFSEPKCQELSPPIITIMSYISDAKMNYWNKILIKLEVSQQFDL